MTIERFAGLTDTQDYTILIYNEKTKKTTKGIKVTGKELQAMARALDALVKQQFAIDGIKENQDGIKEEAITAFSHIPDTGGNPLLQKENVEGGGYESTFMNPQAPSNPEGFNAGGPKAITENPGNAKPPKLP